MRILFIVGACLEVNSSANLCHLAYIRGFCDAGHTVDVLSAHDEEARLDPAMALPAAVKHNYTYPVSLYEKLSHLKNAAKPVSSDDPVPVQSGGGSDSVPGGSLVSRLKSRVRSFYGVYGTDSAWFRHAKSFRSDVWYDVVISLSCPFISHRAAEYLIENGRVDCGRWIQIWEDPWYGDLAYDSHNEACLAEERRLCAAARDIVYVSPLTHMYQRELFPESAHKMRFVPTPSYYPGNADSDGTAAAFGYFGDYDSAVRDLRPFYDAAADSGAEAIVCGNSDSPFVSTERIEIHPRVSLDELKTYEKRTGTLVFLCNKEGGQIPGKIYQYSAQNKPILFILDGTEREKEEIKKYFSQFDRYVFCENDKEDIEKAIERIKAGGVPRSAIDAFSPSRTVEKLLLR